MDLQTLQSQLRSAIQNHQIVVAKMRSDPQNTSLQKQLHDLQAEIMLLSDKQKQVVQQLRKELEKKQQVTISKAHNSVQAASRYSIANKQDNQHPAHEEKIQVGIKHRNVLPARHTYHQVQTHPISLTTKPPITSQPQTQKAVKSVLPAISTSNNVVSTTTTLTIKSPITTVLFPAAAASGAHTLLTAHPSSNNQRTHSVLVVPSVNARNNIDNSHMGMVLNLSSPIRVPQYPPPQGKPLPTASNHSISHTSSHSSPAASTSVITSTATNTSVTCQAVTTSVNFAGKSSPLALTTTTPTPVKVPVIHSKFVDKEEQAKKSFMAALGLITKDTLKELQSKRYERKRRTTANPQFSNAAIEERKRNAALQNSDPLCSQAFKRPRGRPRASITPNNSRPTTPESSPPAGVENTSPNSCSPPQQIVQDEPLQMVKQEVPEHKCDICSQHGDLITCSSCGHTFHLNCLQPPLTAVPENPWCCSKCQSAKPTSSQLPETLAVVHSYIALKTAKEEEKRKLTRRSMELKSELQQLQERVGQLKDTISGQNQIRLELQAAHKKTQESIEKLHNVVSMIKRTS